MISFAQVTPSIPLSALISTKLQMLYYIPKIMNSIY